MVSKDTIVVCCNKCNGRFEGEYYLSEGCKLCGSTDIINTKVCSVCEISFQIHRCGATSLCKEHKTSLGLKWIKYANRRPDAPIPYELFKTLCLRDCELCGWEFTLDIHHVDGDYKNNSPENLIRLCRNHHNYTHLLYKIVDRFAKEVSQLRSSL